MLRSILQRLRSPRPLPRVVRVPSARGRRGRALVSYIREGAVIAGDDDPRLDEHTNRWESRCLVRELAGRGFEVDVIDFRDAGFDPTSARPSYDLLFDLHVNLGRWHERLPKATRRLMHLTGSWFGFSNAAIARRCDQLEARRGVRLAPLATRDEAAYGRSIEAAEACSLIGNAVTLATFPERWRAKMTPMKVTASRCARKDIARPLGREFLWLAGADPVLKGLDLALEVFAARPDRTLHVVGPVGEAGEFHKAYRRELDSLPNIRLHGWMNPASERFATIADRCFACLSTSCTEGMSSSAVTAMSVGLLPILSVNTGVDLPAGCGTLLEHCSIDAIGAAVDEAASHTEAEVRAQVLECREMIDREHSREAFARRMSIHLDEVLA
jgi:glycosyltransferase involved in cell wall biosynthesis